MITLGNEVKKHDTAYNVLIYPSMTCGFFTLGLWPGATSYNTHSGFIQTA